MNDLKNKLIEIFKQKLLNKRPSVEIAIDSIVEFYTHYKIPQTDDIPDNDMLLFQYGTYDYFDGQGENFVLNLTRQIADPNDDEFFQIGLTLFFKPENFGNIESYTLWSIEKSSINDWVKTIKETDGYRKTIDLNPHHYTIEINKT